MFFAILITGAFAGSCHAQSEEPPNASDSEIYPESQLVETQPQADQSQADEDFEAATGPTTSIENGEPLEVLLTPFHVGRLALISATTYEGYNSNPEFQKNPLGSWVTAISGLVAYSTQIYGWRLNLQYQPFVWIASQRTIRDFAAAGLDLRKLHHLNQNWSYAAGERLRYAPTQSTAEGKSFVASPSGGFTIGNAFLSSGRNVLVNAASFTLTDHYSEHSSFIFHLNQDFTQLSTSSGTGLADLPTQQALTYSGGVTWRDHYSVRDTLSLKYEFRAQSATAGENVEFHTVGIGWSHKFTPTLGMSATFGPAWSVYTGNQDRGGSGSGRATVHGSVALNKEFRGGGLVLSASRSDSFSGIISDSFHNRYDMTLHKEFTTRLHGSATASYVQQQFSNRRDSYGELATVEARYFLSRNFAIFSQLRYLSISGSDRILAPEKSAILGVRWSWVPEKP